MGAEGWTFAPGPETIPDSVNRVRTLYELYTLADPQYSGRATIPILWDKHERTIVSNESAEIVRMFNSAFDGVGANRNDYYPAALRAEIDELNDVHLSERQQRRLPRRLRDDARGLRRSGDGGVRRARPLEGRLTTRRYLLGSQLTEADIRLFTTLIRFDPVYHGHFKCNRRRIVDYPNLWGFLRDVYQTPGIAETVHVDFIKRHYYGSHANLNPSRIVPIGPELNYETPHGRERLAH